MLKFFASVLQIIILLNPFAVLSTFLSLTAAYTAGERLRTVSRCGIVAAASCILLYFSGTVIFRLFGINIDIFRIGGGVILMVCAIRMVVGSGDGATSPDAGEDIAAVPLAIPMAVGPGTCSGLIVMGMAERTAANIFIHISAICLAVLLLVIVLWMGIRLEKLLGTRGLSIISKLTGLFLSALAAGMILEGIKNYFY